MILKAHSSGCVFTATGTIPLMNRARLTPHSRQVISIKFRYFYLKKKKSVLSSFKRGIKTRKQEINKRDSPNFCFDAVLSECFDLIAQL